MERGKLSRKHVNTYSMIFLVLFMITGIGLIWYSYPPFFDFSVFWSASRLALAHHASDAYDVSGLRAAVLASYPYAKWEFGWYYPPTFYLTILPVGLLPFFPAYLVFMLTTLCYFGEVLRRIIPGSGALWCLAASGTGLNIYTGQNGFLTAALAGAALLSLERRPVLAGFLIGLLVIKPHLILLFPVALIAIGAWKTLFTSAAVALVFMALATAVLGVNTLMAWQHSLGYAMKLLEFNPPAWSLTPTVFALLRQLGMPVMAAYMGHTFVALGATVTVWKVWRTSSSQSLRYAALITATLLTSPYLYYYDLTWLALPMAWLTKLAQQGSWLPNERGILIVAWLLPLLMGLIFMIAPIQIQIGPLVLLALLWVILRRVFW